MTNSVAIAISAFRSDAAVVSLLDEIFTDSHPEVGTIIVVDSLGSGKIRETATERGWPLWYDNANTNLGSAGNLARRMEISERTGAKWCLCLNHDANWDRDRLSEMLEVARSRPRVGAVYPILDHAPRAPRWEDGRRDYKPSSGKRLHEIPSDEPSAEISWSSSNSALYAIAPLSEGVAVMADLWMGYEDLAYGIALKRNGWAQLSCREARISQIFDYGARRFLGRTLHVPEKPVWYPYYDLRNLILIRHQYGSEGIPRGAIIWKIINSSFRIILFEEKKWTRLRLLLLGVRAGLGGQVGKGSWP